MGDDAGDADTTTALKIGQVSRTVHVQAIETRAQQRERMPAEAEADACVVRGNLLGFGGLRQQDGGLSGRSARQRTGQALNTEGLPMGGPPMPGQCIQSAGT